MTQRKRATGFALMDTAFAADAKFVRLSRRAKTPSEFASAVGVYWLILADARRNRSKDVNWEDFEEYRAEVKLLQSVGLLSIEGFNGPSFDRWAPAYKSPWDKRDKSDDKEGTGDDEGVRNGTESTESYATSTQLSSTQLSSSENGEGGVGETPTLTLLDSEPDGFLEACRLLGYIPNSDDFRNEMTALDSEFGAPAVEAAVGQAYAASVEAGTRPKPFDLKNAAHMILSEARHRATKAAEAERTARREREALADIERQEREAWQKCAQCGDLRRTHRADHAFEDAA